MNTKNVDVKEHINFRRFVHKKLDIYFKKETEIFQFHGISLLLAKSNISDQSCNFHGNLFSSDLLSSCSRKEESSQQFLDAVFEVNFGWLSNPEHQRLAVFVGFLGRGNTGHICIPVQKATSILLFRLLRPAWSRAWFTTLIYSPTKCWKMKLSTGTKCWFPNFQLWPSASVWRHLREFSCMLFLFYCLTALSVKVKVSQQHYPQQTHDGFLSSHWQLE